MKKYNVIRYRLNRNTKPSKVLETLEALLKKYFVFYQECLFNIKGNVCEFEHEGKFHSNRNRNAINTILKLYPELSDFYKYNREQREPSCIVEDVSVCNFSSDDFSFDGVIAYDLICDIVNKVPSPYSVNDLELIYNGVSFGEKNSKSAKIGCSESGYGAPVGNYIWYSRSAYGDEKQSVILFAMDDEKLDFMRQFFFDFAQVLPGKYEGTEYYG